MSRRDWNRLRSRDLVRQRGAESVRGDLPIDVDLYPTRPRKPAPRKADQRAEGERLCAEWKIEKFRERCTERARMVASGRMSLHCAVDGLQSEAECEGLVEQFGQDLIQQELSAAFAKVRS